MIMIKRHIFVFLLSVTRKNWNNGYQISNNGKIKTKVWIMKETLLHTCIHTHIHTYTHTLSKKKEKEDTNNIRLVCFLGKTSWLPSGQTCKTLHNVGLIHIGLM